MHVRTTYTHDKAGYECFWCNQIRSTSTAQPTDHFCKKRIILKFWKSRQTHTHKRQYSPKNPLIAIRATAPSSPNHRQSLWQDGAHLLPLPQSIRRLSPLFLYIPYLKCTHIYFCAHYILFFFSSSQCNLNKKWSRQWRKKNMQKKLIHTYALLTRTSFFLLLSLLPVGICIRFSPLFSISE